jgi:NADH:ubiquinone oxidoreductase subunit F (NADH-binding)
VALLLRFGAAWWRSGGGAGVAGSRLATVVGAVDVPGSVVEVVGRATIGDVLTAAGVADPPRAVLVGGFAGTWVDGTEAWTAGFDRAGLDRLGASPGCGLLAVLPADGCGLAETARVVAYLAGESAGQCGPCVRGLPDLADLVAELHAGRAGRRARRHLVDLVRTLPGSGACRHPDGVALLVRSALAVFGDEVGHHRAGRGCPGEGRPPVLDVPGPAAGGRGWT